MFFNFKGFNKKKKCGFITNINIIPEPVSLHISPKKFTLTKNTLIISDQNFNKLSEYLKNLIYPATGFKLENYDLNNAPANKRSINLILLDNSNDLDFEGYTLEITPLNIKISATSPNGIFYGIQTLRQLLPIEMEEKKLIQNVKWKIPCLKIIDYPRFSWRGYMLDEARHFHGKEIVKGLIDLLALFKMNRFHWHLTDDQGWRIEIKKYPKLTNIGSKREETQVGGLLSKKRDGIPHSGYYTQEDIQEIVNYAKIRFIEVVPEIDLPGHSRALLASYPNISCKGYPFRVSTRWGYHKDVLCIGKERVFEFISDILTEIVSLFPLNIIHIGGDEVLKKRWKECPDCQNRIQSEGLQNEKQLQSYFTNRISRYLNDKNQKVICWNDVLDNSLKEDVICQYWLRGKKKVREHIKNGGDVIMSNFKYTYLDHSYSFTPLELTYKFDPIPKKLNRKDYNHILGLEALMWGEYIPNKERLEWQTFPRLIALAEIGWTPKIKKNFSAFYNRLLSLLKRLDLLGINYAKLYEVKGTFRKRLFKWFTLLTEEKGGTKNSNF